MRFLSLSSLCLLLSFGLICCGGPGDSLDPDSFYAGGLTTVEDVTRNAYGNISPNHTDEHHTAFFVGNSFFNNGWVIAPASTGKRDGLGPVFNAKACTSCHLRDGRGRPPEKGEPMLSMLVRLSIPGKGPHGGPNPEPRYGLQLNNNAIPGVPPEGHVEITYEEIKGQYADGTPYTLQKPTYTFKDLKFGDMPKNILFSPRVAPPVYGLGLLEAIAEKDILANADPDDKDEDGISGRPNMVWDVKAKKIVLGRFGLKANQPNLEQQNAGAFLGDIGITSPLFPKENCTDVQKECKSAKHGGAPEVPQEKIDQVTAYVRLLAVPARRNWKDPEVQRGKKIFYEAGCQKCHKAQWKTDKLDGFPELANQKIYPYTDLLLHDMGDGLADNRPDFEATGKEWRTPPLWGIGLLKIVNRHTLLLHDGRARNIAEAILWHGGEGEASKEAFRQLPAADRDALVAFLKSI